MCSYVGTLGPMSASHRRLGTLVTHGDPMARPNSVTCIVWNRRLSLNPNLSHGNQTLTGTSVLLKIDRGFEWQTVDEYRRGRT
jgi:hypothetical protein